MSSKNPVLKFAALQCFTAYPRDFSEKQRRNCSWHMAVAPASSLSGSVGSIGSVGFSVSTWPPGQTKKHHKNHQNPSIGIIGKTTKTTEDTLRSPKRACLPNPFWLISQFLQHLRASVMAKKYCGPRRSEARLQTWILRSCETFCFSDS